MSSPRCTLRQVWRHNAGVELRNIENAGQQAVEAVHGAIWPSRPTSAVLGISLTCPLIMLEQQGQRLHRLAQIVTGGGQEFRLGEIGALGFRLGVGERLFRHLALGNIEAGGDRPHKHAVFVDFGYPSAFDPARFAVVADDPIGDGAVALASDKLTNSRSGLARDTPARCAKACPPSSWRYRPAPSGLAACSPSRGRSFPPVAVVRS